MQLPVSPIDMLAGTHEEAFGPPLFFGCVFVSSKTSLGLGIFCLLGRFGPFWRLSTGGMMGFPSGELAEAELTGRRLERSVRERQHRIAVGMRLRLAREATGIQQIDAARALGYGAATQLNEAEAGKRMLSTIRLVALAKMYGTTMDYFFALSEDMDADPVGVMERCLTDYVLERFSGLARAMARNNIDAVRKMGLDMAETLRLSHLVLEIDAAVGKMRAADPKLDNEVRGLATVVNKLQAASESSRRVIERSQRARRAEMLHMSQVAGDLFSSLEDGAADAFGGMGFLATAAGATTAPGKERGV